MSRAPEGFKVRIHANDHLPPHCHVYMSDETEYRISLPLLEELSGKKIPKKVYKYLLANLDSLADEWETTHPYPKYTEK
ncbi:MAG: DUF4160 domain-containing protein [Bacteroidetes bacterium]|nr:DUF4160 domain-containing protein [Bacteroidota bacterium]MBS1628681.1 DUF4160 domain-containing protein [Bacteroidota bacterium]